MVLLGVGMRASNDISSIIDALQPLCRKEGDKCHFPVPKANVCIPGTYCPKAASKEGTCQYVNGGLTCVIPPTDPCENQRVGTKCTIIPFSPKVDENKTST